MMDALSTAEQLRAGRLLPHHRERFITARAALRRVLATELDLPPAQVPLTINRLGKPTLDGIDRPLHFNLSHVGDWALIALMHGSAVGMDVEVVNPTRGLDKLAARCFTPAEIDWWESSGKQPDEFYRIWTRKEAVVKALGMGFRLPLRDFGVVESDTYKYKVVSQRNELVGLTITVVDLDMGKGYAAAASVLSIPERIWLWDYDLGE